MASTDGEGIDFPILFNSTAEAMDDLREAARTGVDPVDSLMDEETVQSGLEPRGWWMWMR